MTDDDERARPGRDERAETVAVIAVEVVGRLVEQGDRRASQADAAHRREHGLPSGERADGSIEHPRVEACVGQGCARAGLDVPVVADLLEPGRVDIAVGDRAHGAQ